MGRFKHLIRPFIRLFILMSAIGYWYIILPQHYIALILHLFLWSTVLLVSFWILGNLTTVAIKRLRRRYKWARELFINPAR